MKVKRATFNKVLETLRNHLVLNPTNLKLHPTLPERLVGLTVCRLAYGVTYGVIEDVFGVLKGAGCVFLIKWLAL